MANKLPWIFSGSKVCIICEGDEEYEYLDKLISKTTIDMIETGKHLKKLAQRKGYSSKDIQQYLGLSCPQPVYRWYKGVILPSVDNLLRLSELYQVHMEELLVKTGYILNYDVEKIKKSNFEERIRAYYLKLVA